MSFTRRFWVGCAVILLSVSFIIVTLLHSSDARRLAASNRIIDATVIGHSEIGRMADPNTSSYFLDYQFTFNGNLISNSRSVPEAFFLNHPVGTTWPIRVHTHDPNLHDLYDGQTRNTAWGYLAMATLMAAVGAYFALSNGNLAALRARFNRPGS